MKKLLLIALVVAAGLTSCKKSYTCDCKGSSIESDKSYPLGKQKKKDAKDACDAYNKSWKVYGGSCELK